LISYAKRSFERCFRNSPKHKRGDNCGDLLIKFFESFGDYLTRLIQYTEVMMQSLVETDPSTREGFKIVGKILGML